MVTRPDRAALRKPSALREPVFSSDSGCEKALEA